jgi:hypothetical protein
LACHLQIDADQDPSYPFDADPYPAYYFDADPTFQLDVSPESCSA